MKPATAGAPYRVPPEPSRWSATLLAVAVHALLLAFLWFGIRWQNTEPVAVEAEVWDMKVVTAAAPPLPPEPAPEPEPAPQVAEPAPAETPLVPMPPDINLERERQRKAEQQAREREEALKKEAEEKAREQQKAKELARKAAEKKKEAERIAAEKKAEKLAKAKAAAEEQKRLDKLREAELRRIAGAIGATGSAAKSTAPRSDSGYIASITAKIKSTTTYGGSTDVAGNPKAVFRVEQLPTGEIMSVKKVKSSGVPQFDDAVEKGIIKASPLPKKKDGTVERSLEVNFSMKDLD